jgi:hypothetical protein
MWLVIRTNIDSKDPDSNLAVIGLLYKMAVSTTVPEGSTTVMDSTVWYESRRRLQRMPPALFDNTPPSVAAWRPLAGSGPSR